MSLYKRTRISTRKINIEEEDINCQDVGLYVLSQKPDLEYSRDDIFLLFDDNTIWSDLAEDTLVYTVLNTLLSKTIELYKYSDHVNYFWGLYDKTTISYSFKICRPHTNEDLLTNELLKVIKFVERGNNGNADFRYVVKGLIYRFSYYSRHQPAEKLFLLKNLKLYARKYPWLSINSKKGTVNILLKKEKVNVNKIYIPRISMQMEELVKTHKNLLKTNWDYGYFIIQLKNCIDDYFSSIPRT